MINPASKANRILKSGTFQPDSERMPPKISQCVRITTLPFQTMKAGVQIRLNSRQKAGRISDGFDRGFELIGQAVHLGCASILTIGGVAGQNPAITTKQQTVEMPMKSKIAAPAAQIANDGRGAGTAPAGSCSLVFIGIGSFGVHIVLHGDVRRHPRISGILMESRHSVADGDDATNR
jgi:hypothetical protein